MKRRPLQKKGSLKTFALITLAAALIGITLLYFLTKDGDQVVAKVNNEKIHKSEFEEKLRNVFESQNFGEKGVELKIPNIVDLPKEVVEILAKEIYLEHELNKKAARSKVATTKEVKGKITDSKNKIMRQAYVDYILKERVSDQVVMEKYNELSRDLTDKKEYLISHIVLKTKDESGKVIKELNPKKGQNFAELAKKYSIDKDSATRGGELGYILEDNMIKEISEIVSHLKKGQFSDPIQTKFGWHIIKVSEIREAKALAFESVKDNIREQLTQDALNEINAEITRDAKIKILIDLKAPLPETNSEPVAEEKSAAEQPEKNTKDEPQKQSETKATTKK